jgi:hypothetical protein
MGSAYVPSQTVQQIYVGNTTVPNPYIMFTLNGVAYPNGYRVDYVGGYRNFYGTFDPATGNCFLSCQTVAYGEDLPAFTLSNVEVLVIE